MNGDQGRGRLRDDVDIVGAVTLDDDAAPPAWPA
jgi:hypothetical protein